MSSPFAVFAAETLERWLAAHPVDATLLGDHNHDHELDNPSIDAAVARAADLRVQLATLDALDIEDDPDERIDAEVLRTALSVELLDLDDVDEPAWNPMVHNPGTALYSLASRPFISATKRLDSARARLSAIPTYLAAARDRLGSVSRPHVETAIAQLDGTIALIDTALPDLATEAGGTLGAEADAARTALVAHQDWLRGKLDEAERDPRLGADRFRAKLALTLDTDFVPEALLARAEKDLDRITAQLIDEAGRFADVAEPDASTVKAVLDELARDVPNDETILPLCRDALTATTQFVRDLDLVTVYDDPIDIIEMPEIDRGVAGAYCNPSGPLEAEPLPTQFAVSPTPKDWSPDRVASYYREYNKHLLHDLTIHEAMPGHALQLMHSNRHRASTPIRAVFGSGSFIEGWAVYSEELMALRGYRRDESERAGAALRMHQLKMQLRTTLNTILDIRFHCADLDERAAVELMTRRGFQQDGEAIEKWRRVQLTSTQLCTYYVGYCEVRDLAIDLRRAHPDWRECELHDSILGHGSPPVRHLRTLLLG
ncbi:MAG TPA: DUF885 domain-containing protein [Jatrophihabitantaceae bacterium]|nr:DUF885 domain-containing protein [Jatrophihabitantaceae bacterium]